MSPDTAIRRAIAALTGDILQVPTTVSAIKVDGKRAHALVRAGEDVALKPRPVTVSQFVVHDARAAVVPVVGTPGTPTEVPVLDLDVSVVVSAGTYVRALARDLGAALGSAGHLTRLRRTRAGGYDLADAQTLEQLEAAADQANAEGHALPTLPMAEAAARYLPSRAITQTEAIDLGHGRWIGPNPGQGVYAAIDPAGDLVALVENVAATHKAKPVIVFAGSN